MVVLITGGSGKLGRELIKVFPGALHPTHEELDITSQSTVFNFIQKNKPDVIIHAAALASIPRCENDRDLAWKTNVEGTAHLAAACLEFNKGCYFVYISTACVFQGDRENYTELDLPYPKNFYSLTKLLGEYMVRQVPKNLIIRTNFVAKDKWLYPKAFIDRFGTYLYSADVARGVKEVIQEDMSGIIHIVGDRKLSMYELAKLTTPDIEPMTLADYQGPPLTIDMSLNTVRWKKYKLGEAG